MSRGKILFQLTGSIACFKACQLLSRLVREGFEVEVVATRASLNFVGEATLEGLTGRPVHTDVFAKGEYMQHIHLIRWANLVLVCPATAHSVNKLASGSGNDLLGALFLAHDFQKPYLIAPAMNSQMLTHPATQHSLAKLASWGVEILPTGNGSLACGESGEGRLLEPDLLFAEIERRFGQVSRSLRLLVTAGGTREPIDEIRSITNFSTGRTGAFLAEHLSRRGHRVELLGSEGSMPARGVPTTKFTTTESLRDQLRRDLSRHDFDGIIHAAAVGDFSVGSPVRGKIESSKALTLNLKPNPKLIDELRSYSRNPKVRIIGFKLTHDPDPIAQREAVFKLQSRAHPDLIVHNDFTSIQGELHPATLYDSKMQAVARTRTREELASALAHFLEDE